jgi:transcription elongation GreA/GreB family factor
MMDAAMTFEELETRFFSLLEIRPLPVTDLLPLLQAITTTTDAGKAEEWTMLLIEELVDATDFRGLFLTVMDQVEPLSRALAPDAILRLFKQTCPDRLTDVMLDVAQFGERPLCEALKRLGTLLALEPGTQVIDPAWGFGVIQEADSFYKRFIVDFTRKPRHEIPFATACDSLVPAPQDHLLTVRHNDPGGFAQIVREQPGELLRLTLRSYGDLTAVRIEDLLVQEKILAPDEWKGFWDAARKALKQDPLVVFPAKKSEPLRLLTEAESYGDAWFATFSATKNPERLLTQAIELETAGRIENLDAAQRAILEERLHFALDAAHQSDAALYARLAVMLSRFGFLTPPTDQLRAHLWEEHRFLRASEALTVKDTADLATFLLAEGSAAAQRLLDALPQMPFSLLNEVLNRLNTSAEAEEACRRLLTQPKAPPTLVYWAFRNRDTLGWRLPPLHELLDHAIQIVESRLSGEALRMQNQLKRLFGQTSWLESVFAELDMPQRQRIFERIQASPAWDPATHRSLLGRMLQLDPSLTERKKAAPAPTRESVRWTSWRSLAERQFQYKKLIEVDLPKNSRDIAIARSYGDLRENFEYQAAKDFQRQLLQRQTEIQQELQLVKGTDFADAPHETAGPGTRVALCLADNTHIVYTILGEWDRDEALNIISSRSRLALCLTGRTAGDSVRIPGPSGEETARIEAVLPLDKPIREWIRTPPPAMS